MERLVGQLIFERWLITDLFFLRSFFIASSKKKQQKKTTTKTRSLTHSLTHSLAHSLAHSLTHSLTHLHTSMTSYRAKLVTQSLEFLDDESGSFVTKHKINTGTADKFKFEKASDALADIDCAAVSASSATLSSTLGVSGAATLSDSLAVTGAATLSSTLAVTGAATLSNSLAVTGAATLSDTLAVTNAATFNGAVTMSEGGSVAENKFLTLSSQPTADTHAANKLYVDSVAQGLDAKDACQVGTTAAINVSATDIASIDGVDLAEDMRVLVKDQGVDDKAQNGIYVVRADGGLDRAVDFDANGEVKGAYTLVQEGTVNGGNGFVCTSPNGDDSVTVGSTEIVWAQFSGAGQITAGDGMSKVGNTMSVNVDDSSIEVDSGSDNLQIKALGVTNAMLAGSIENAKLSNFEISGVALGQDLASLAVDSNSGLSMTSYNGSGAGVSDLKMDINSLTEVAAVLADTDAMAFADADASNATKKVSVSNIKDTVYAAVSGDALIAAGGALTIQAGAVQGSMLNGDVVDNSSLQLDSSVLKIKTSGVATAMIADDAVDADKIADDSISNAHIAGGAAIAISKLAANTISGVELGNNLFALSAANNGGLSMTSFNGAGANVSDLQIDFASNTGLEVEAGEGLRLKAGVAGDGIEMASESGAQVLSLTLNGASSGLSLDASGLLINIDGSSTQNASSLELTTNGIRIKPDADIEVQSMTVSSDERLKDNISTIEDGLVTINSIRPVTWDWKSNGEKASGVVAQQLQQQLPYLVNENQLKLSVNYNGLSGHIISAIQQLSAKVDELSGFAHP